MISIRTCLISLFVVFLVILVENSETKENAQKVTSTKVTTNKKLIPVKKFKWHRSRRSSNHSKLRKQEFHQLTSFMNERFCKMEDHITSFVNEKFSKLKEQVETVTHLVEGLTTKLAKHLHKSNKNLTSNKTEKELTSWGNFENCLSLSSNENLPNEDDAEIKEIFIKSAHECPIIIYKGVPSRDCTSITGKTSGIYRIKTDYNEKAIPIYCDMDQNGWIMIQRRSVYGNLSFTRDWKSYKDGFGLLCQDFWIGNQFIHHLTTVSNFSLMVELTNVNGLKQRAVYNKFHITSEKDGYKLFVDDFNGGDALDGLSFHNESAFSTLDYAGNLYDLACALLENGGWWYKHNSYSNYTKCSHRFLGSNLNAPFSKNFETKEDQVAFCADNTPQEEKVKFSNSIYWRGRGDYISVEMKIKSRNKK